CALRVIARVILYWGGAAPLFPMLPTRKGPTMKMLASQKTARRDDRQRKFFLESLERRTLLAGNVSAASDSTNALLITGDKKDNNVALMEDANGDLTLSSANSKINGQTSPLDLTGLLNGNANFNG